MKIFGKSDKNEKSPIMSLLLTCFLCIAMPLSVKFCMTQIVAYNAQYDSQELLDYLDNSRYEKRMREQEALLREQEKVQQEMDEFVEKVMEMVNGENGQNTENN